MLFALIFLTQLNKILYPNINNKVFSDQTIVIDQKSDTNTLSFIPNIYEEEEIESKLDYINKNSTICII